MIDLITRRNIYKSVIVKLTTMNRLGNEIGTLAAETLAFRCEPTTIDYGRIDERWFL